MVNAKKINNFPARDECCLELLYNRYISLVSTHDLKIHWQAQVRNQTGRSTIITL